MKLYLVRHCQTAGNAAFKIQGAKTPGQLTVRGRKQLAALKTFFSKEKIDELYCSPLERAMQTASALGKPVVREELKEIDFGNVEGASHEEAKSGKPDLFDSVFESPKHRFPRGESLADVAKRLQPFVRFLQAQGGNPTVVVVGHNIVNRVLLSMLLGLPLEYCRIFKLKNASIAELDANPHHRRLYLLHNGFASIGKRQPR